MKLAKFIIITFFIGAGTSTHAQKIKLKEGSVEALKNEKAFKFEYNYDSMSVGEFPKEADFVAKRTLELNQSNPGRGDKWAASWVSDRKDLCEPKFEDEFNREFKTIEDADTKYTIIVHTTATEPGYMGSVAGILPGGKKAAEITAEITIVETADHTKKIAVITIERAEGRQTSHGMIYDEHLRISLAYGRLARDLAKFIKKK
ncbi:MAG: hypothetical protein QM737_09395 [Ferruginibacter sp.]